MRTADAAVRLLLNVAPHVLDDAGMPQHVAFSSSDAKALARAARERGAEFLPVSDNYYDYLAGRFGLDEATVAELRDLGLLYDRDASGGEFVHFYTRTVGTKCRGRTMCRRRQRRQLMVQTDASINPGNSVGSLSNLDDQEIGMNTAIATVAGPETGSIGIGFAVPIDRAATVARQIIAND